MKKLFLYSLILFIASCNNNTEVQDSCYTGENPPRKSNTATIDQGLAGDIWFYEGNFTPTSNTGKICPVKREVYIYELTSLNDVERVGTSSFFTKINTNLIASTESDDNGFFQVDLAPGRYSLFIKEDGQFYAKVNNSDAISGVTIESGKVSEALFNITYKSVW